MTAFIDRHLDHFGVEAICRILGAMERGFLTSRVYRAAKQHPASARAIRDEVPFEEIRRIHAENYGVYGYRKMHHAMRRAGWEVGRDQTAELVKAAGLRELDGAGRWSRRALLVARTVVLIWTSETSRPPGRISSGSLTSPTSGSRPGSPTPRSSRTSSREGLSAGQWQPASTPRHCHCRLSSRPSRPPRQKRLGLG